jgi:hypothetical protein
MGECLDTGTQRTLEEAIRSGRVTKVFTTGGAADGTVGSNAGRMSIKPQDALMADEMNACPDKSKQTQWGR